MTVECDAILLGREAIHGTANAFVLAGLVKTLSRKQSFESRKRYILKCGKDCGLQMIPFRSTDDEGFESDEDLISLGSYEESAAENNNNGSSKNRPNSEKTSSQLAKIIVISNGSVSSIGTDSANSSGGSDNDDNEQFDTNIQKNDSSSAIESYQFHEIAFCHTDPSLPKVIVWVVKTKKKNKNSEFSYGLEAIVFYCRILEKFRAICKCFQEFSRRSKLEKPFKHQNRLLTSSDILSSTTTGYEKKFNELEILRYNNNEGISVKNNSSQSENRFKNNENSFNLIQRIDTDGVTHIEVSRSTNKDIKNFPTGISSNFESSNIISINTPDSGNFRSFQNLTENPPPNQIESVIRTDIDTSDKVETPTVIVPERPERKKDFKKNFGKDKAPPPPPPLENQEKVVRGHFVRVSVDQKSFPSSPVIERPRWIFGNEAKPTGNTLSYKDINSSSNYWNNYAHASNDVRINHRSQQSQKNQNYKRSKSIGTNFRRSESPKKRTTNNSNNNYPMSHRYIDTCPVNNSLPNRFFDKLRELTIGSGSTNTSSTRFRRRNSIGDLANGKFYQPIQNRPLDYNNRPLTKSTPNLKSVIKNKNSNFSKNKNSECSEPKKVTFSAYATVQVVD